MKKKPTKQARRKAAKPARKATKRTGKRHATPPTKDTMLAHRHVIDLDFSVIDDLLGIMHTSGVQAEVAADRLGIPEARFTEWLKMGERESDAGIRSPCAFLWAGLKATDSGVEIELARKILADPDWRAAAFMLQARFPRRWDAATARAAVNAVPDSTSDGEWVEMTTEEIGVQFAYQHARVMAGEPLVHVPVDPYSDDDRANDPEKKAGVRQVIAENLREFILNGERIPGFVVRQVEEYFGESLPHPPQEEPEPNAAT